MRHRIFNYYIPIIIHKPDKNMGKRTSAQWAMGTRVDSVFVVKVQVSLSSSDGLCYVLVYDRARQYMVEFPFPSKEAIRLIGLDPELPKSFYIAQLIDDSDHPGKKKIELLEKVKDEDW